MKYEGTPHVITPSWQTQGNGLEKMATRLKAVCCAVAVLPWVSGFTGAPGAVQHSALRSLGGATCAVCYPIESRPFIGLGSALAALPWTGRPNGPGLGARRLMRRNARSNCDNQGVCCPVLRGWQVVEQFSALVTGVVALQ